jgi:6-phosphogluconolactonase
MADAVTTGADGDRRIVVAADAAALAAATEGTLRNLLAAAIAERGRAWIALAGGRTPRAVYERLAQPGTPAHDWPRVHVAFGDERLVPPDHADSNYGMARAALLSRVPLPGGQVHRIRGELPATAAAATAYADELADAFALAPGSFPVFDVILLGIGADGHTASLFPRTTALHEKACVAIGVKAPAAPIERVTLTFPVLNAAREVVILTAGADKADAVARALAVNGDVETCPVRGVRPPGGRVTWHLDPAAASRLPAAGIQ